MWEENPRELFQGNSRGQVGTENPIHIVPLVVFEPGSQNGKIRAVKTVVTVVAIIEPCIIVTFHTPDGRVGRMG